MEKSIHKPNMTLFRRQALEWSRAPSISRAVQILKGLTDFTNYAFAFLIILTLNFVLPRLMPGDPLEAIYGEEAMVVMTPQLEADIIQRFSLDQSLSEQFSSYLWALLHGDLGYSYYYNDQVMNVIMGFLPWTLLLAGSALIISTLIGLVLGIESGYLRGKALDKMLLASLMFLNGFPDFFVGILLLLFFGVIWGMVPLSGALTPYSDLTGLALVSDILHHLATPLTALVLVWITSTYLLTRNTMISTLKDGFITTAKAKGCRVGDIKYKHAGRNSLLPVVTSTGLHIPHVLTGALFVEIVFAYPGVGLLLYNSLLTRDYPLIQGILLMVTVTVLFVNLSMDLLYHKLDPRVCRAR